MSDGMSMHEWKRYRDILKNISDKAANDFRDAVWSANGKWKGAGLGNIPRQDLIDYAYALVTKYGEGAAAVACELYDALAERQGAKVPAAVPAKTASYQKVAKTVNGTIKQTINEEVISGAVGRLVKQAGQDTTLQNAKRDGARVAWVPSGDTCAFCITLASKGWQSVKDAAGDDATAKHIHSNCDCAYAVQFDKRFNVQGYDPGYYAKLYDNAPGKSSKDKINAMRREFYEENKDAINEQKRSAYEKRKERNSSAAEELNV